MIVGTIKDANKYASVNEYFPAIFEQLAKLTPDTMKGVVIEEGRAWFGGGKSDPHKRDADPVFEAHENFLDIHFIVEGEETFGYADVSHLNVTKEYDPKIDALFLKGHINEIKLKTGDFCVVFPEDAHIPCMECGEGHYRVVAKVRVKD